MRSFWKLLLLAVSVTGLGCAETCTPPESTVRMYALKVTGDWHNYVCVGRQWVHQGSVQTYDTVQAGKIECNASGQNSEPATLELLVGTQAEKLDCKKSQPIPSSSSTESPSSSLAEFGMAMSGLFVKSRSLPRPAMVRGFSSSAADAVVRWTPDGSIDLTPALRTLKPRRYRLQFMPLEDPGSATPTELEATWKDPAPAIVKAAKLAPGFYRMNVVTPDDLETDVGTWAAVLVAGDSTYDRAVKALDEAHRLVSLANPPLSETGARSLYILVLSSFGKK